LTWIATHNGAEVARHEKWDVVELALSRRIADNRTPARATLSRALIDAESGKPVSLTDGADTYVIAPAAPVEMVAHKERGHSVLGASGATRWMNCPASVRLSEGIPDRPSPAAQKGTAAHEVAHMCLENGQDAIEYVGRVVSEVEITDDIAEAVQVYLDDCRVLIRAGLVCWYEVQFDLTPLGPPVPMFGTADFVAYDPDARRLYVRDYKNGYLHVAAEGNDQLRYYALGAILQIGPGQPIAEVELTICQPNGAGASLKRETISTMDLHLWAEGLLAKARRTQDPDAPAVPGPWCKFCRASPCATQAEARLAEAGLEFASIGAGPPALPETRTLTPADLGRMLHAAPMIREFLDAVDAATRQNPAGTGWKVVETEGRVRPWRNAEDAAQALPVLLDIDPWAPREVITPAEARRRIVAATLADHPTKKAAEAAAKLALAGLLGPAKSGTALVPDADPRPAISDGSEFDKVTP